MDLGPFVFKSLSVLIFYHTPETKLQWWDAVSKCSALNGLIRLITPGSWWEGWVGYGKSLSFVTTALDQDKVVSQKEGSNPQRTPRLQLLRVWVVVCLPGPAKVPTRHFCEPLKPHTPGRHPLMRRPQWQCNFCSSLDLTRSLFLF